MFHNLKCYDGDGYGCFACEDGCCTILSSFIDEKSMRHHGTKEYREKGCPFRKTAEEAHGTCRELCEKYTLNFGRGQEE